MEYEICYLVGESNEAQLEKIKEEVKNIISQEGNKILPAEKIEKRKMAYKVEKEVRGIYIACRFETPQDEDEKMENENAIENITKKLNLKNEVLRFMIVKADELPPLIKKEETKIEEKAEKSKVEKLDKKPEEKNKAKNEIDDELDKILNI